MDELEVDALLLSHGADLPWLTGYQAMPLERLTMLVLPRAGDPVLVVPALEAPRVDDAGDLFDLRGWTETEDPVAIVASLLARHGSGGDRRTGDSGASSQAGNRPGPLRLAVSDRAWATSVLALQRAVPDGEWMTASTVTSPVRAIKDAAEVRALRAAGAAADRVAGLLQGGSIALVGRTESDVSKEIASLLLDEGHDRVNFAIVGSGANAASPHHEPGSRVIGTGETAVCDFGGTVSLDGDIGYCSDITRTVVTGSPSAEVVECYDVLRSAQQAAVSAAHAGVPAEDVDGAARRVIADGGYGELFIHRTGHGIGIEEHEDPYLVAGNASPLEVGHTFSVEPGLALPGRFGMRLEDIVTITDDGAPERLNSADHALVIMDA